MDHAGDGDANTIDDPLLGPSIGRAAVRGLEQSLVGQPLRGDVRRRQLVAVLCTFIATRSSGVIAALIALMMSAMLVGDVRVHQRHDVRGEEQALRVLERRRSRRSR